MDESALRFSRESSAIVSAMLLLFLDTSSVVNQVGVIFSMEDFLLNSGRLKENTLTLVGNIYLRNVAAYLVNIFST